MMEEVEHLAQLIIQRQRVVVFTGAGISTESGIPDFRSPGGIWSRYDPEDFTIQKFLSGPAARRTIWKMSLEGGLLTEAKPNLAHYAIADLYQLGKLDCVITQNIDNLHQKAGVPEDKVFELHGNMGWVVCLGCHRRFTMPEVLRKIKEGVEAPDCPDCQGILKPDAVFFGEALPQGTLREAIRRAQNCDLFIVIGSTLVIYPAAYIPTYAREAGAKLAIVNLTPTPFDDYAEVVIRGKAGQIMSEVIKRVRLS
ncbi:MAG: Sir2 family NAD-dependent protein deacetylase [Dehalococcoidia bacterium]|nr:Sir2 family NAD-dependent protein deacetylase [Dehalococcoidia bacterium]MDH4367083.1 Sir2 family NAD-dependent protein deacetylase [Dehalococcoidia bacterium]